MKAYGAATVNAEGKELIKTNQTKNVEDPGKGKLNDR